MIKPTFAWLTLGLVFIIFLESLKKFFLRIVFLQDSDGEAGIALVGVHSDFPKYEVNILPLVFYLIEISSYTNLPLKYYTSYMSPHTRPVLHVFELYFLK